MPYFSVVIPTYNRAHSIHKAIDSVLNQSFQDFEIIIVDDSSTDHTKEVVAEIDDNRIHYICLFQVEQFNRILFYLKINVLNEQKYKVNI